MHFHKEPKPGSSWNSDLCSTANEKQPGCRETRMISIIKKRIFCEQSLALELLCNAIPQAVRVEIKHHACLNCLNPHASHTTGSVQKNNYSGIPLYLAMDSTAPPAPTQIPHPPIIMHRIFCSVSKLTSRTPLSLCRQC